jgi:[calcium/calmodulin-dependent protein kinase] kinase
MPPPRINTNEQTPSDITSSDSSTSSAGSTSTIKPQNLLAPAAINVSPPTPIDSKASPFQQKGSSGDGRLGPSGKPVAAHQFSQSPSRESSLLVPEAEPGEPEGAGLSRTTSNASTSSATSILQSHFHPLSRTHSPSSPRHRPKGLQHRRTSSTHRVKESQGKTRNAEDGARMVNNYKIGKSLGQGAYAKVDLAVDVTKGDEYVS